MSTKTEDQNESRFPYKVLLAEDDIISARSIEKSLAEWGYKVTSARDGLKAWEAIQEGDIRIAILDWMMPKIEGIELCRKIRQDFQKNDSQYIYIILITGKGQQSDIINGLSAGADDYITKPFHFQELKVRLQNGERIIFLEENRMQMANTDDLTKLWNKKKIMELFGQELARGKRNSLPIGLIMIDVDKFKQVNDLHGHPVGDVILEEIATRLKRSLRIYDKIGRYGGDEFIVVLPECSTPLTASIAERLRSSIAGDDIKVKDISLSVTISLGVVSSNSTPDASTEDLIKACDKALYKAKKEGRNQFQLVTL